MNRIIPALVGAIALGGCAQSGVSSGNSQGGTVYGNILASDQRLLNEADQYCAQRGKVAVMLSDINTGGPMVQARFFRCMQDDDVLKAK